jgi:hypothetical protein
MPKLHAPHLSTMIHSQCCLLNITGREMDSLAALASPYGSLAMLCW